MVLHRGRVFRFLQRVAYTRSIFRLPITPDSFGQHAYGLSNQTFQKWFVDSLKGLAIGMVFGCLLLWVPYLLVRRSPRRWWLYTSLLAIPVMVFTMLIEPIWIEPMFNRFEPLKDKQLEARILIAGPAGGNRGQPRLRGR